MRILTRYVLREFLQPVIYCLVGFSLIYLIIDLFGEFEKILQARPPLTLIFTYLGGYLASVLNWLVPASLLLGGLYAMWQLARHSEITAMRANGIGFSTITAPILWAATGFAILLALNSEFYAPEAGRTAKLIKNHRFVPGKYSEDIYYDVPFLNVAERREWRIGRLDLDANWAHNVRITWTDEEGQPLRVAFAARAAWLDGVWWFMEMQITEYDERSGVRQALAPGPVIEVMSWPELRERPRDFFLELIHSDGERERLSLRDMIRYTKARPRLARDLKVGWRYDIYNRIASPWTCLIITLFSIPAGVATGRQSVFFGVMMAVGLFFAYYALSLICGGLAKKDLIPVGVGVLLPHGLLLATGLVLYFRQR